MNPSPNLFLIGPMGAGKSSIGRRLATHFGLSFTDLDSLIERRTGTTITTIFAVEGEAGFRARESALLAEVAMQDGLLLATGGGTILAPENRRILRERGFVAWLQADVDQQLARLARDRQRPLLATADRRTRLGQLAAERDPIYRELADLAVPGDAESCRTAAERIADLLEGHWRRAADAGIPS